jgi:hypothetical protein
MQEFPIWVKVRLLQRRMTVSDLARRVRRHRTTVSTAIHNGDRFPAAREAIRKALA